MRCSSCDESGGSQDSVRMKRVVIIQEYLPHYRKRFFELLREELAEAGISLEVVFSDLGDRRFVVDPPEWARAVRAGRWGPMVWQSAWRWVRDADLVIVPQEVKYLLSHILQLRSRWGSGRFAFWGHGRNFQAEDPDCLAEKFKRGISSKVDWWFAYNDLSAKVVGEFGFPAERVTVVGNSVDTQLLREARSEITPAVLEALRARTGIRSEQVAVFTGGLHRHKRVGFLLEAAVMIRERVPDFELIVIGDGPDRPLVARAAETHPWIHDIGKLDDRRKVPFWEISKLLLMPGLVGLVAVDSFVLGVPIVTTDYPFHSPEIDYLRSGENGIMVPNWERASDYADEVAGLLRDQQRLDRLRAGALESAGSYSIENMARNMTRGIEAALAGG